MVIDDAHGCGVYEPALSSKDVPLLIAPLGKTFGSCGAVVAGNADLIDAICQLARSYMFNTALPPIIPYATLQSLKIVENESWRREMLFNNIDFFNREAKKRSLKLVSDDRTPIRCVLAKDINHLNAITSELKENNMLVSSIRAPTVPKNMPRMRISLSCFHLEDDIVNLLNILSGFYG